MERGSAIPTTESTPTFSLISVRASVPARSCKVA